MLILSLLFSKVETIPETSSKKKGKKRKKARAAAKVFEGFTLVNSFLKRDESISFLKPVSGVDEVNYPPGTKFEMVEVWVDFVSLLDSADREPSLRVHERNLDFVRRLLPDNIKIEINKFETAAENLVFCGRNLSVIEKLLQSGSTISYRRHGGVEMDTGTLAHYAALRKSTYLIPVLQRCGVDLDVEDSDGWTPLNVAVLYNHLEMVMALLNNGANPNKPMEDGSTALHQAVGCKCLSTVVALLEYGADVNATNEDNQTPLDFASEINDNKAIIEILLKNGVDFNSAAGSPALLLRAVRHNALEFVQKLLEHGARANQTHFPMEIPLPSFLDGCEVAPIHVACAYADEKMVQLLLDHGADPNVESDARAPITIAVTRGARSIVHLLLSNGVTVYDRPDLLILAARDPLLVEILLKNGCDVNLEYSDEDEDEYEFEYEDDDGAEDKGEGKKINKIKAIEDACTQGKEESVYMLMKYGASFDFFDLQNMFSASYGKIPFQVFLSLLAYSFTDLEKNDETKVLALFRDFDLDADLEESDHDWEEDYLYDTEMKRRHYARLLAKHLVKLKVAGKQIDESIIPPELNDTFGLYIFQAGCEGEIEGLKRSIICKNAGISLYDILTKSVNTVSRYFKNENIRRPLINYNFEEKPLLYGRIIQFRVKQADWRREFLMEGMKSFNLLVCRLPRLPPELKEEILSLLSTQDLIKLHLCFPTK